MWIDELFGGRLRLFQSVQALARDLRHSLPAERDSFVNRDPELQ